VEAVKERSLRASRAIQNAEIPDAILDAIPGGNAIAAWVARVDITAVRNTRDVDTLVRRQDFSRIQTALETVGFHYHHVTSVDCFIDGPNGTPRDAVRLLHVGEKVKPEYDSPSATVDQSVPADDFQVVDLEPLVRMKLNSFRRKKTPLTQGTPLNSASSTQLSRQDPPARRPPARTPQRPQRIEGSSPNSQLPTPHSLKTARTGKKNVGQNPATRQTTCIRLHFTEPEKRVTVTQRNEVRVGGSSRPDRPKVFRLIKVG